MLRTIGILGHGVARWLRAQRCFTLRSGLALLRTDRGIAATEFALILPIMILLYVGTGELSQAVMTNRRIETLSRTLVDLVAQQPTSGQLLSIPAPGNATVAATLQSIMTASSAVMAPSPLASLTMTVSAVDIVNNTSGVCCAFKVRWSFTQSGSLRPCNVNLTPVSPTQAPSPSTVSSAMMPPVVGAPIPSPVPMLISDVSYTYSAPFSSQWLTFPLTMNRTSYMLPRTTGQVIAQAPLSGASNQSGAICY